MMDNIRKNNRLIAEFMGYKYSFPAMKSIGDWEVEYINVLSKYKPKNYNVYLSELKDYVIPHKLDYHKNWNSLMEVIKYIYDRVEGSDFGIFGLGESDVEYEAYEKFEDYVGNYFITSGIEKVYEGIIKFIKWYNKQKEYLNKK